MMTTNVKGRSIEEAELLIREFRDMATGKLDTASQPNHLGRLSVFAGVRDLPSRVKCAILPWHTLQAALNSEAMISTEGDRDPVETER
jgi:nitrogen fixation NifU-like protein